MGFVNEYIPEEDVEKYGIREINRSFPPYSGIPSTNVRRTDWTIDRERNIYLRKVTGGRFEDSRLSGWTFFWRGELMWFLKEGLAGGGKINAPQWEHIRISKLSPPPHLKLHQKEILDDLREAFRVFASDGVFSTATEYSIEIDFVLEE